MSAWHVYVGQRKRYLHIYCLRLLLTVGGLLAIRWIRLLLTVRLLTVRLLTIRLLTVCLLRWPRRRRVVTTRRRAYDGPEFVSPFQCWGTQCVTYLAVRRTWDRRSYKSRYWTWMSDWLGTLGKQRTGGWKVACYRNQRLIFCRARTCCRPKLRRRPSASLEPLTPSS